MHPINGTVKLVRNNRSETNDVSIILLALAYDVIGLVKINVSIIHDDGTILSHAIILFPLIINDVIAIVTYSINTVT